MTAVTTQAFVHVSRDEAMVPVRFGPIVGMANRATENGVVRGIGMAVIAGGPFVRMGARINGKTMRDEPGARKSQCGVTGLAGFGKARSGMIRIRYRVVFTAMTRITIHRRACVSPSKVTVHAQHGCVSARQCEAEAAVVESCAPKLSRGVTKLAVLRKTGRNVVRRYCRVVLFEMARHA